MNLDRIPSGSVLLDANIVLYARMGASPQCSRLLERCAGGEVRGVLASHILSEVMHGLMMAEAAVGGFAGSNRAQRLADQPEKVKRLRGYQEAVRDLLAMGLQHETLQREDFLTAMVYQERAGLLTNDALLLAVGERLRVKSVATADKGFRRASDFTLYAPDDLRC
jgi:predicted nucleic acid-binding protein